MKDILIGIALCLLILTWVVDYSNGEEIAQGKNLILLREIDQEAGVVMVFVCLTFEGRDGTFCLPIEETKLEVGQ